MARGLLLQSQSCSAEHCSPRERVRTLVLILEERSTQSVDSVFRMNVGPEGLDLTPFARQIYKHPDVEVYFVQVNIKPKIHHTSQMMVSSCMAGVPYKGQLFIAFFNKQNVYLPMDGW